MDDYDDISQSFAPLLNISHAILIVALLTLCALTLFSIWLLIQHVRLRSKALVEEARLLAAPAPPEQELPHVLVQIPSFNEGFLVHRVAEAAGKLDWPRDRLHVQILDDSTDGSAALASEAAECLRRLGIDTVLLHRTSRVGFKAGALAAGLAQSEPEFIAIFDADYVPRPDFLRVCMPPMLRDSRLALVQARCDFINADENWLTGVQRRILDSQFAVEQATRSWLGLILPFNGTCGIWRRTAITAVGGWHGDTLAEDLDLSFRVQAKGWKARYLVTITVPGELPNTLPAWETQQSRWAKGLAQVARKVLPMVWGSKLRLRTKIAATLHLGACIVGPAICAAVLAGMVDITLGAGLTIPARALLVVAMGLGLGSLAASLLLGQRMARGSDMRAEARELPRVIWLMHYALFMGLRGIIEGFIGRASAFVRTPKKAAPGPAVASASEER